MVGRAKRKKKEDDFADAESGSSDTEDMVDKYKIFKVENYVRQYPEDGGNFEYLVIYESSDANPLGEKDLMSMGASLQRYNKGIKRFKRLNRYKIGAIFERPGLANLALNNLKAQNDLKLKATIPAASSETTGVIRNVPTDMSNQHIYNGISSSKNVVAVRRLMRRVRDEQGNTSLQPTQTVAITFACPNLPSNVDINAWYFEVSPYTPPVNQCLKCLRFGHIGKFCKNAQKCSICGEGHHFSDCNKSAKEAVCTNCKGNHIAISAECPIKKKKIEENKIKSRNVTYANLLNGKSFPPLIPKKPIDQIRDFLENDDFTQLLVTSITKIVLSLKKDKETKITTDNIKSILLDTFSTLKKDRTK